MKPPKPLVKKRFGKMFFRLKEGGPIEAITILSPLAGKLQFFRLKEGGPIEAFR